MQRSASPICAVLVHVADWRAGLAWYRRAFPSATVVQFPDSEWECIEVDGVQIEVVPADDKVGSGSAGTVVYWAAEDLDARLDYLRSVGAALYRGPLEIEGDMAMCQVKDPFGNLIGIRGPRRRAGHHASLPAAPAPVG